LKVIKVILALIAITISTYSLITKDFSYSPLATLLLGIFFAIVGVEEFKNKGRNSLGMVYIPLSCLAIAMALFSF